MDHDYAPELLRKWREYAEAKAALKERNIRFQTPFPTRLRGFYEEGMVIYSSAEEATADMARRGVRLRVLKKTTSLLDQISQVTWQFSEMRGNWDKTSSKQGFREQLQAPVLLL